MNILHLTGYGVKIKVSNVRSRSQLTVTNGRENYRNKPATITFRPRKIPYDTIIIDGHSGYISLKALHWLSRNNIPVFILNFDGTLITSILPPTPIKADVRKAQMQAAADEAKRFHIAYALIQAKIKRTLDVLQWIGERYDIDDKIRRVKGEALALFKTKTVNSIRMVEGRVALRYWQAYTDNIYDEVVVERDNIVVDGAGYMVQGTGAYASKGIDLTGRNEVTIKNMEIKLLSCGIYLDYASKNNSIVGNNITNNSDHGIWLGSSSNNGIFGNNIKNNLRGICLWHSSNNSIVGNMFTNDGLIISSYSHGNVVEDNLVNGKPLVYLEGVSGVEIKDATEPGQIILINCDNIHVENLNLSRTDVSIQLWNTNNTKITGNNITNNQYGIFLRCSSSNNIISGNNITNNRSGIYLGYSSNNNNSISGNNITNNSNIGIYLAYSSNNSISGNNITNNSDHGIRLDKYSSNNIISGNNITNNRSGIGFGYSSNNNNSISGNNITNNSDIGIGLSFCSSNIIFGNNITESNWYGIALFRGSEYNSIVGNNITNNNYSIGLYYESLGNVIYHNNFVDNTNQVYIERPDYANFWDDGYPSGGNYWSDHNGNDLYSGTYQNETGCDGIGDTPYVIDANNQDNYPLMNPWPSGWKLDFTAPTRHPIVDFAVYNGSLYAAADNKLYVYNGSWNALNAPTFVTSLEPYEDKLIVGGQGGLHYYDGTPFGLIFSVPTYIKVLGVYDNRLYAGTMLDKPPTLYYCNGSCENPSNWYVDTDFTAMLNFSGPFGSIDSFAVYDGVMYVTSGSTLYSYNETNWSIVKTYGDVYAFLDMQVYNGKLYFATRDQAWRKPIYQGYSGFSGRIIEFDGNNWTTIFDHDYWIFSLETYDSKLYAGTANKIYTYNGTDWETSFYSEEGAYYAISMITYDGKIYAGMGNGYIFEDPSLEALTTETIVVPEFPLSSTLLLFMIATLLAVIIYGRKHAM